jgi:hypothetical protein
MMNTKHAHTLYAHHNCLQNHVDSLGFILLMCRLSSFDSLDLDDDGGGGGGGGGEGRLGGGGGKGVMTTLDG